MSMTSTCVKFYLGTDEKHRDEGKGGEGKAEKGREEKGKGGDFCKSCPILTILYSPFLSTTGVLNPGSKDTVNSLTSDGKFCMNMSPRQRHHRSHQIFEV